jgi:hypothetical protein
MPPPGGTNASRIAGIDAGQEVTLTSSTGRCFVIGPSGS